MTNRGIEGLVASWEPKMRQAFLDAVYEIRSGVRLTDLIRLLEQGRIDDAVRAVGLDPGKFRSLNSTLAAAYEAGGVLALSAIPPAVVEAGYRLSIGFNMRNLRAEEWLRSRSELLIREITEDQRRMIREVLVRGLEQGRAPRDVATDLLGKINRATGRREHGLIGLTETQVQWARSYALELATGDPAALERKMRDARFDKVIRKAIAEGRGLTKEEALPAFRAYLHRALRLRAETIARTEMMTAIHAAQDESYWQAIEAGILSASLVTKTWRSMRDERVRSTHRSKNELLHRGMDGQTVAFEDQFQSPSGARLRWPGDPWAPLHETINCRCHLVYKVDYLRDLV